MTGVAFSIRDFFRSQACGAIKSIDKAVDPLDRLHPLDVQAHGLDHALMRLQVVEKRLQGVARQVTRPSLRLWTARRIRRRDGWRQRGRVSKGTLSTNQANLDADTNAAPPG